MQTSIVCEKYYFWSFNQLYWSRYKVREHFEMVSIFIIDKIQGLLYCTYNYIIYWTILCYVVLSAYECVKTTENHRNRKIFFPCCRYRIWYSRGREVKPIKFSRTSCTPPTILQTLGPCLKHRKHRLFIENIPRENRVLTAR